MKIMMENKKKQWIYLALMLVSIGGTGWIWFGSSSTPTINVDPTIIDQAMFGPSAQTGPANSMLPYGKTFNTKIFSDSNFQSLIIPSELTVQKEELGKDNPFSQ